MMDGHGGDCGGGDHFASGGGDGGAAWDVGNPKQPEPIDKPLKINGHAVTEQSHEFVIEKNDAAH